MQRNEHNSNEPTGKTHPAECQDVVIVDDQTSWSLKGMQIDVIRFGILVIENPRLFSGRAVAEITESRSIITQSRGLILLMPLKQPNQGSGGSDFQTFGPIFFVRALSEEAFPG
jgi:hypothetical protein